MIKQLFNRVFGKSNPIQAPVKEWPEKISVRLVEKEVKTPRIPATETYQSRWGYHPVSYETFLKLKELHKWYHMTLRHLGCWVRWNRKTVHRYGPEPKYCPTFVKDRIDWWYTPSGACKSYPKTRVDHGICEAYHAARMPTATPEEVESLNTSEEEINRLHTEVSEWFSRV